MSKKVIFIDVDGTLISFQKYLPNSAVKAIKLARENGHLVILCTGRSKAQMFKEIWDIGIDGYIGGNGSYIELNDEVIFHEELSLQECKNIVDFFDQEGIEYYLESNNGLFLSKNFEKVGGDAFINYHKLLEVKDFDKTTVYTALQGIKETDNYYREDINKISYVLNNETDYQKINDKFPKLSHGLWGGSSIKPIFGYISKPNVSKGEAIKLCLKHLNMKKEDAISFGDSNVDLSMFDETKISVCLGGGTLDAKNHASIIADTLENDGLYKAFIDLKLI